jgi:hypothetical protein
VDYKLENVSYVMKSLGLPGIPGYRGRPHIQQALVPEVRRQAVARGLLPAEALDFAVMAVYAGEAAQTNVVRGLVTRTWGFPKWDSLYEGQPSIGLVIIASHYSGGSPRVQSTQWLTGTVDLHVCRFVGPFVAAHAPHWEDELAENTIKYPCRFGIEPIAHLEGVSLAPGGPLGTEVADAIRRSGANRGMGNLVVGWDPGSLQPGELPDPGKGPSPVTMTDDLPETGQRRRRGLGRMSDAALRKAVEVRAMDVVRKHFKSQGWRLEDTSTRRSWDYEATRGDEQIRIEVKGTTGVGTHVQLTAGEVINALSYPGCVLGVVFDIVLDTSGPEPVASGGQFHLIQPWELDESHLRPLAYEYRVPGA